MVEKTLVRYCRNVFRTMYRCWYIVVTAYVNITLLLLDMTASTNTPYNPLLLGSIIVYTSPRTIVCAKLTCYSATAATTTACAAPRTLTAAGTKMRAPAGLTNLG